MAVKIAHQKGARYLLSVRFLVMFVHVCYDGRRCLMIFVCGLKSCGAVQVLQKGIASHMHSIMKLLMDCAQLEE